MTLVKIPSELRIVAHQYIKERDYWLDKLSGEWVKSSFSYDYRKEITGINKDEFQFRIPKEIFVKLMKLSNGVDDLLHIALSASLILLLNKYSGASDIVIGTPIYRQDKQKEFINTVLVLRNRFGGHNTFKDLLVQVRQSIIDAIEHQNYPIEILMEQLNLPVSLEDFPLFDIVILLKNIHDKGYISHIHPNMIISFLRTPAGIEGLLEYNTSLYRNDTIEGIIKHFIHLMGMVLSRLDAPLSTIDVLIEEEKQDLLINFNDTKTGYPKHKTISQLFEEQVEKIPHNIALVYENQSITYKNLDESANKLANYFYIENKIQPNDPVGLLLERSILLIVSIMGILKAGGAYVPIDSFFPEERIKNMIKDASIGIFVSQKKFIRTLHRMQWECPSLHTFICVDSEDILAEEEVERSELMSQKLWEYVGETAVDEITGGGWSSSYTGEPIPKEEMDEYGDNILKKLLPILRKDMRVLEIGCATGISMYRIAPRVGLYYGTDLSSVIIQRNKERVNEEGHRNIILSCLPADEIDSIPEKDFDLIIINSVIQCFHGHNYLRKVIRKSIKKIKDKGWLFIGDVMNQDLKEELIKDLVKFKQTTHNQGRKNVKTKIDWSAELFVSPSFFKDLLLDIPEIREVEFSDKIYTIENELTKFRYDSLFTIDKSETSKKRSSNRCKYQHDLRTLRKYGVEPVNPGLKPTDLAYIIYTSGSTGRPKGTLTNHFNVIRVVKDTNYLKLTENDRLLQLSNYAFDGSVFDIYGALLNGSMLVMVKQQDVFAIDKLSTLITREKISVFFVTTALFNVLVDIEIGAFRNVRNVLFGGEQVSLAHAAKALKYLGRDRIIHVYGPTETTVYATYYFINEIEEGQITIPIGKPIANTILYILDNEMKPLPIGAPGELYIGGDGLARGYLNQPELTAEKFLENPYPHPLTLAGGDPDRSPLGDNESGFQVRESRGKDLIHQTCDTNLSTFHHSTVPVAERSGAKLYRTGDLVRWLSSDHIEFLGRIDKQVKLRGFRIELGEIEHQLLKYPDIKEAAVLVRDDTDGENYLCAYIVPHTKSHPEISPVLSISELSEYLAMELPDFMVPAHFIELASLPLTPNGKIDKKALPKPGAVVGSGYIAPRNPIQQHLAHIWSEILGIDKNCISIDANFFEIGGHSLKATVLMSRVHKEMHVKVQLSEIFKTPTIRELSEYFKKAERKSYISINPVEKNEYYILSPAQKRLYLLHQMGAVYNMMAVWFLEGELKKERLEETFRQLIRRHESLRTSFLMVEGVPVQKIQEAHEVEFTVEYHEVTESRTDEVEIIMEFNRLFDISRAPLLRVGLIKTGSEEHILMINMHHIVSDGTSLGIFIKEFSAIYAGETLAGLRLQYKEYSEWQDREYRGTVMKKQEEHWLKQFDSEVPLLNLPYDYPRPEFQSFAGSTIDFDLAGEETGAIKSYAVGEDATLYIVLLALFNVLLAKLSGNEDITVGTPIAGRRHMDLQPIIGMFVGTLAMRSYPAPHKTFAGLIGEVKEYTLGAFENQDYPFENLVEKVVVNRDAGRNPLFDVMFALQNIDLPRIEIAGLKLSPYKYDRGVAFFDLFLQCYEVQDGLVFILNYCTKLFKKETVARFIKYFRKILSLFIKNPHSRIAEIEIISEDEKRKIVNDFNNTRIDYPTGKTIPRLFEEQAMKRPDSIAVYGVGHNALPSRLEHFTYRELNRQAHRLAAALVERGIKPDDIAGIMTNPSIEMIVGVFATLKAGGAYLPIDPESPGESKQYILRDSNAKVLITAHSLFEEGEKPGMVEYEVIFLEEVEKFRNLEVEKDFHRGLSSSSQPLSSSENLAYVIYTSGSTGKPKGVIVEHRSALNILLSLQDAYPMSRNDCYLLKTSCTFDVSVAELFGWFFGGGRLVIIGKNERKDPQKILDTIQSGKITHINFVPSLFNVLLKLLDRQNIYKLATLRYIFLAGEALPPLLVKKFRSLGIKVILENIYGPTEGTVYSSRYSLLNWNGAGNIPIGKPLPNIKLYILDNEGHLQPIGVSGELTISGTGVARGYLNNPELTNERFLNDPFLEGNRMYRTGDLTQWLPDGNIAFLGRIDHQVKIRGFRVELGEIEHRLLERGDIKEAVVTLKSDEKGDKYLCAYIVDVKDSVGAQRAVPSSSRLIDQELREYLSHTLPDYMVPSFFVQLEKIPLTSSGKVNRNSLPEPEVQPKEKYTAPRSELEEKLVEIWSEVLNIEKKSIIGIDDNFFELGGHSLKGTILMAKIRKDFNAEVSLSEIFKRPTIRKLAQCVRETVRTKQLSINAVEEKSYYVLSFNQRRVWFIRQRDPQSPAYNMPAIIDLPHSIDSDALKKALAGLIRRHESLRTGFKNFEDEPIQFIVPQVEKLPFRELDLSHFEKQEREQRWKNAFIAESRCIFDLGRVPLFRTLLVKLAEKHFKLILTMDHIVSDGWSMEIFERELLHCYECFRKGEKIELEPIKLHYKDFSEWHNRQMADSEVSRKSHQFWKQKVEQGIPPLVLPRNIDGDSRDIRGALYRFMIPEELRKKLKKLSETNNTTLFMVTFTTYIIALSRYSNQKDIVCSIISAGREHETFYPVIGFFVNSVLFRIQVHAEEGFEEFLQRVQTDVLACFQHQYYPLELVFEEMKMRYPDIPVAFNMVNLPGTQEIKSLEPYDPYHISDTHDVKFDLEPYIIEYKNGIDIRWAYKKSLFDALTIESFVEDYMKLLEFFTTDPHGSYGDFRTAGKKRKFRRNR